MHPLAGQGLNLGIADAEALAQVLADAADIGADVGSLGALRPYEAARQPVNLGIMSGIDALRRIFDWEPSVGLAAPHLPPHLRLSAWSPVRVGRNAGLALLNGAPALKRILARVAMGV